ncbi:MAG: T9SS type A sorting domain-containing protein [Bacteroidetes bacterium]|nr:T9SS type A sorting domain-containing protein [Bacteroidota bacterium]
MKKFLLLFILSVSCIYMQAQQISNFENWHNYNGGLLSLTIPNGWGGTDSLIGYYGALSNPTGTFVPQVSKEIPGNGGTGTALRVTTLNQDALNGFIAAGPMPCLASNSIINVDVLTGAFIYTGGTPFTYNPYVATMWIKNGPAAGDSTEITILAIDDSDGPDSIVSIADTVLGSAISNFTQITIPFVMQNPTFNTTKLRVLISSSANFIIDQTPAFANLTAGSWLVVDDIMISAPNGTSQYLLSEKVAAVYPTVLENELHVNLKPDDPLHYQLQVLDMNGHKVNTFAIDHMLNTFDVSSLASGNYLFNISQANQVIQSGKLTKK